MYAVEPRSFLVIGNLGQVLGNEDKVACFELYRRNIRAPEILTFDELFQRASCIVENISREAPPLQATPPRSKRCPVLSSMLPNERQRLAPHLHRPITLPGGGELRTIRDAGN